MADTPRKTLRLPARPADAVPANSKRKPLRVSKAPRSRGPSAAPVAPNAPAAKKDWRNKNNPGSGTADGSRPRSAARPATADGAAPKRWRQDAPEAGREWRRDGERSGGRDFGRDSGREFNRERDGERRPAPAREGREGRPWRGADEAPRAPRGERPARPEFGGERRPRESYGDREGRRDGERSGGREFGRDSGREFNRERDGERRPSFARENRDGERGSYAAPRPAPAQPKPFKSHATAPASGERPSRPVREKFVPVRQAPPDAGVRVAKLMAERGLCSRREADVYIERGWVFVDGQRVTELGTRVQPSANISLDKQARATQARQMTVLLHKPVGFVSGQPEPGFRPAVSLVVPENQCCTPDTPLFHPACLKGLAPAGRLDIDSTGLLVLTQDGRIARQLVGDDSDVEKEYLVRVAGNLIENGLVLLNHGLTLDGVELRPAQVEWLNDDQLRFILKEGRKRQIRRMCELVGLRVVGLKRVRIGNVRLADLPPGQWRYLREDEGF